MLSGIITPLVYEFVLTEKQQAIPTDAPNGTIDSKQADVEEKDTSV